MFTIVLLLLFALIFSIGLLCYGIVDVDRDPAFGIGLILSIIFGFAFAMTSVEADISTRSEITPVEIVRTSRMVIIDTGTQTYEFTSYSDVTAITDTTKFETIYETNFYGHESIKTIKLIK